MFGLPSLSRLKKILKTQLLANGSYVYADIDGVIRNTSVAINHMHPYNIRCQWNNPSDGNIYLFKSENIWFNPEYILKNKNITALKVYFDRANPKRYFISLDKLYDNSGSRIIEV